MNIQEIITNRNIHELLHFTTSKGLLGILSTGKLLPRSLLLEEEYLEFILQTNTAYRSDPRWVSFVSLSISKINHIFYDASKKFANNKGLSWAIVSISPEVLLHEGVYFSTTNNIYPSCERGMGAMAFEKLFSPKIYGRYNKLISRTDNHHSNWTTCPQAEVLYPGQILAQYIKSIYVQNEVELDTVHAQIAALGSAAEYNIIIAPEKFRNDS